MVQTVAKTTAERAPTPAEAALLIKFDEGKPLNLNRSGQRRMHDGRPVRDEERVIRASVLRDLLLSAAPAAGYVQQLTVIGADIRGPLDLQFAKIDCPVRLEDCWFYSRITLSEAQLRSVSLSRSTAERGIDARHVRVTGDLMLERLQVFGSLQLSGAHLDDDLHLTGTNIYPEHLALRHLVPRARGDDPGRAGGSRHPERALLDLENIQVSGRVLADQLHVGGKVDMNGATVGGTVHLDGSDFGSLSEASAGGQAGDAWCGDGLRVDGEVDASGLWARGQVSLVDAQLQSLVLTGLHIDGCAAQPALLMDRMQCTGSLFCDGRISLAGGISAKGINVGASFYLGQGEVLAPSPSRNQKSRDQERWAVALQRARIGDDLRCEKEFCSAGKFDISSARIGGTVDLGGTVLGPAEGQDIGFDAGRAQIGGNLKCERPFTCAGIMALRNAKIDGFVKVEETSQDHSQLLGSGLHVGRYVELETRGPIDLSGAEITENLTINLTNLIVVPGGAAGPPAADLTEPPDAGPAEPPDADLTQPAAADLSGLSARVLKLDGRQQGVLDLTRASVRLLIADPRQWYPGESAPAWIPAWLAKRTPSLKDRLKLDAQHRIARVSPIVLDGLVYDDIAPVATSARPRECLAWLEAGTTVTRRSDPAPATGAGTHARYFSCGFVPQPYHQLAEFYRRSGRDADARNVLYTMYCTHNSTINKDHHHPILRVWNALQNVALGYGYRPKRAFGWILLLTALTTAWIILYDHSHISIIAAAILSLGLALPGTGIDRIQGMVKMTEMGDLFALGLVLAGLVLGATVIAAIGRAIRN